MRQAGRRTGESRLESAPRRGRTLPGPPRYAGGPVAADRPPARTPHHISPRRVGRCLVLASGSCALLVLGQGVALADDFSEFRIPPNRSLLWTAGLNTRASGADGNMTNTQYSGSSVNGAVSSGLAWFSDSDPAFTDARVVFVVQGFRSGNTSTSQQVFPSGSSDQNSVASDRSMFEDWSLGLSHRRYPWTVPLGFDVAVNLRGRYFQSWSTEDAQSLYLQSGGSFETNTSSYGERWSYRNSVTASASAGWGRVRNATGIYDALVLEERLLGTGALARPLSPAARRRLADVMYLRGALDAVRQRPGRFLWREIERVLSEDGALREGGLDAYSLLRATEPHLGASVKPTVDGVPVSPVARMTGHFVGVRLSDQHENVLNRSDGGSSVETILNGTDRTTAFSSYSTRSESITDRVLGGLGGELHRPFGRWQLDASGSALTALRREEHFLNGVAQASLSWLAADRWTASAIASYSWFDENRTDGATGGDNWQWLFNLVVSYYLEDRAAIELAVAQDQRWTRGGESASFSRPHSFSRNVSVTLGLTYRFAGWFAAPGYFASPGVLPGAP